MRVLHLSAGNLYGGVETLLTTLARLRLQVPQMEPQFGLCFRGRQWDELTAAGAVVHDLGPARVSRPHTVMRARKRLRQVLAVTRPDAVITHNAWPHAIFAPVVRDAGCRLAITMHSAFTGHWVERMASLTRPDLVIANSRFTAASWVGAFPGVPVAVWYLPIAPPSVSATRAEVRSEFGTPAHTVVLLQVSRLEHWKGQAVLLDALSCLNGLPNWECWVVGGAQRPGEKRYLSELRTAARHGGITSRVRFLGQRSDVPHLLAAADIFCQPNTGPEPFGIAFVEALYAGLPVVTSSIGGGAEIVTADCGILTAAGDARAVATGLTTLVRDPQLVRTLGAAGPARARELCEPQMQLAALLHHLRGTCAEPAEAVVRAPAPTDPAARRSFQPLRRSRRCSI